MTGPGGDPQDSRGFVVGLATAGGRAGIPSTTTFELCRAGKYFRLRSQIPRFSVSPRPELSSFHQSLEVISRTPSLYGRGSQRSSSRAAVMS